MVRRLLLLNGLAALGAVLYHATGWGYTAMFWWTDRYAAVSVPDFSQVGSASYYALRVVEQFVTFGVPAFLFVSGFFMAFASGRANRVGWTLVASRLKTLLPPFVLWSSLILFGRVMEGGVTSPVVFARRLVLGQAAEPFYYIPVLAQLLVLSPAIVWGLKRRPVAVLVAAGVVQALVQALRYPILLGADVPWASTAWGYLPSWFFPHLVFWFTLGAFAGLHWSAFTAWLTRLARVMPWVALALFVAALVEWELLLRYSGGPWIAARATLVDSLYSGAFILAFLAVLHAWVPGHRDLDALGERSFGIYLIHAPVQEALARGLYHAAPALLGHQSALQALLLAGGVGVPLALMALVNRSRLRPAYKLVFG